MKTNKPTESISSSIRGDSSKALQSQPKSISNSELPSISHLTSKRNPDWGNYQKIWILGGTVAALASIAMGYLLAPKVGTLDSPIVNKYQGPVATGFGVLTQSSNAVWDNHTIQCGDLLPTGTIKLQSGLAKLELFSGVQIILEGKAEFELLSTMSMTMHRGKLLAEVPEPAIGFRVLTSTGEVVDLGTRFAINVTPEHNDLQVLEGEIEWHPKSAQKETLLDGDKLRWTTAGKQESSPKNSNLFENTLNFDQNHDTRLQTWEQQSQTLRNDPRLLTYYAMEEPATNGVRVLSDSSAQENHGTIVQTSRTRNRWGQSDRALDFSATGSRVRLNIPGRHQALTLFCWVRVDGLTRRSNSLFLSDGRRINQPHWQITNDGRLSLAVRKRRERAPVKYIALSPPIWTSIPSGKWLQIATVYDSLAGTTTHYLNGEQVSQDQLPPEEIVTNVTIGAATIGNWTLPGRKNPRFTVRNLNGAIDEFALFSSPLTADEIKNLYEIGKP